MLAREDENGVLMKGVEHHGELAIGQVGKPEAGDGCPEGALGWLDRDSTHGDSSHANASTIRQPRLLSG
jgi:hypothetical protein